MTLDEAIKYGKEMVEIGETYEINKGILEEYRQLTEWLKELKQLRKQTRWIPCSERLPESDEDVLVTNGIGMYVGWIEPTDKGWRVDSESEYFMDDIVAWMPLPQPYKAESEE